MSGGTCCIIGGLHSRMVLQVVLLLVICTVGVLVLIVLQVVCTIRVVVLVVLLVVRTFTQNFWCRVRLRRAELNWVFHTRDI